MICNETIFEGEECQNVCGQHISDDNLVHDECLFDMDSGDEIDEFFQHSKAQYAEWFTTGEMVCKEPVECQYCSQMIMPGDKMIADVDIYGKVNWAVHKEDYDEMSEAEFLDALGVDGMQVAEADGCVSVEASISDDGGWDDD